MAEFLIRAKGHWLDGADINGMTVDEAKAYNARSEKGDIIVVRPDGWTWGRLECLPDFIVVKIPDFDPAGKYEEALMSGKDILKRRKYRVPSNWVDLAISKNLSVVTYKKKVVLDNLIKKIL